MKSTMDINEVPDEFCMVASFSTWMKSWPILNANGYKHVGYYDGKGNLITYFKKLK